MLFREREVQGGPALAAVLEQQVRVHRLLGEKRLRRGERGQEVVEQQALQADITRRFTAEWSIRAFLVAHPASLYFKEPRLEAVMQVSALGGVFIGLNNIGLVMFRRDLNFRMDFVTGLLTKVFSVVPTLILVLIYRFVKSKSST